MKFNLSETSKNTFGWITFLFWCTITLVLLFAHEPWRDELQSYLLTKKLSLPALFEQMKYEGHFLLWYILLKIPVLMNVPVELCNISAWLLTVPAVYYILFCSKLDPLLKVITVFSAPFLYWYSIFARCYSPIPLLLAGIALLYPARKKHFILYGILISLLANTHVYMEGLVLFLFLELLYSFRKERSNADNISAGQLKDSLPFLYSAAIIFSGVLFAFLTVVRAVFLSDASAVTSSPWEKILPVCMNFAYLLYPLSKIFTPHLSSSFIEYFYTGGTFFCMILFIYLFRKERRMYLPAAGLLLLSVLFICIFPGKSHWLRAAVYLLFLPGILFSRNSFIITGFLFAVLWQFLFAVSVHGFIIPQRGLLPFLICLFLYILTVNTAEKEKKDNSFIRKYLIIYFLFTLPGTLAIVFADLILPYSGYTSCKDFLRKNVSEKTIICVWKTEDASSLLSAMLPNRFYALDSKKFLSFHPHNFKESDFTDPLETLNKSDIQKKVIILSAAGRKEEEMEKYISTGKYIYTKVFCNKMNSIDPFERYVIYIQEKKEK